jgi:hypothetical protein
MFSEAGNGRILTVVEPSAARFFVAVMFSTVRFDKIAFHVIRNSHHSLAAFTSASLPAVHILNKVNAAYTLLLCFSKIRFNIIPPI